MLEFIDNLLLLSMKKGGTSAPNALSASRRILLKIFRHVHRGEPAFDFLVLSLVSIDLALKSICPCGGSIGGGLCGIGVDLRGSGSGLCFANAFIVSCIIRKRFGQCGLGIRKLLSEPGVLCLQKAKNAVDLLKQSSHECHLLMVEVFKFPEFFLQEFIETEKHRLLVAVEEFSASPA